MRTRNSLRQSRPPAGLPVIRANDPAAAAPFIPPPAADERLTGDGGAELAARDLPTIRRAHEEQSVASGAQGGPGAPALGAPAEPDPDALRRRYAELLATPAEDGNGRLRSGARMMGTPIQPTDSLGNAIGQLAGKFVAGLINPGADEEMIDRPRALRAAQSAAQAEAAQEGTAQKRREAEQEAELRAAQIKKVKVETEELPKMNESKLRQGAQTRLISQLRVAGRYKRGENPGLDRQIDEAGMNVSDFEKGGKFQWHTSGGQVYTMDSTTGHIAEGAVNDKPIVDASKVPNAQGLTPAQAAAAADRDADRILRERLFEKGLASREHIAEQGRKLQQERNRLSASAFAARYPGFGKPPLKLSEIRQMAKDAKMLEEDVVKKALDKAYRIEGLGEQ
jgi:hypothetical protein